jgi:uncharacterized protein (TIGR02271 family)
MTQTVIAVFDTPDTAYDVEETLMNQAGIDESCFHIAAQEGSLRESGQPGQSMDEIESFLIELFGPENQEQVEYYARQIRRGGALLSVDLPDDTQIEPIREAMLNAGATDMNARQSESGEAGGGAPAEALDESQAIPMIEEEMKVGKRKVGKGKLRVTSRMEETPVQQKVKLTEEHAVIRSRPVNRAASPEDMAASDEGIIEVEESAEKAVIKKNARVVEELEVGKESSQKTKTVKDTVRHTEIDVEKEPSKGSSRKRGK